MTSLIAVLIAIVVLFALAIVAARAGNLTFTLRRSPKPKGDKS